MSDDIREIDDHSGTETTGHDWDGIKELDTPLPKWWLWSFYVSIVWGLIYAVVMPAWPYFGPDGWDYTKGLIGYSQRDVVAADIASVEAGRADIRGRIAEVDYATILGDADLLQFAVGSGKAAFGDNCAGCHGQGAQGFTGFPNLNDDDWLWGGSIDDIAYTIRHGIRWEADFDTRYSMMPRFLADGLLSREEIGDVTQYVLSLSSSPRDAESAARGGAIFQEQCAACHGEQGQGDVFQGAPNLSDAIWLYGGDEETVYESIANARFGVMPSWGNRLDEETIKELAVYVYSLGGGEGAGQP